MVLVTSVLVLGGCVSIQTFSGVQTEVGGKVRLTLTICATGFDDGDDPDPEAEDHPGCSVALSNYTGFPYPEDGAQYQLLFAIRVPVGTGVPETISATPVPAPPAAGTIVARRSASYEAGLQATVPADAGAQWIGYLSDPYDFSDGDDDVPAQSGQVVVDLALPPTMDGGPFVGPLQVRPVVGARQIAGSFTADRPVDCGPDPFTSSEDVTVCVDSPSAAAVTGPGVPVFTRDFGIVAGNATASAGQTVAVPFGVRGAGVLPAGLTTSLAAATSLLGVGVAPSIPSAPLSNGSDARVTVPVAIPADAAPGVYEVVLTGRLENGQERRGVAQLTVRARPPVPDVTKPKLSEGQAEGVQGGDEEEAEAWHECVVHLERGGKRPGRGRALLEVREAEGEEGEAQGGQARALPALCRDGRRSDQGRQGRREQLPLQRQGEAQVAEGRLLPARADADRRRGQSRRGCSRAVRHQALTARRVVQRHGASVDRLELSDRLARATMRT